MLVDQFVADLPRGDTIKVRNAADFLGRNRTLSAIAPLRATIHRTDLGAEARLAVVRAIGYMAHTSGNDVLVAAMADSDAGVRAAAVTAWRGIREPADRAAGGPAARRPATRSFAPRPPRWSVR